MFVLPVVDDVPSFSVSSLQPCDALRKWLCDSRYFRRSHDEPPSYYISIAKITAELRITKHRCCAAPNTAPGQAPSALAQLSCQSLPFLELGLAKAMLGWRSQGSEATTLPRPRIADTFALRCISGI